jgi:uncharacterized protein YutE (UPF0331/DUF86 family)
VAPALGPPHVPGGDYGGDQPRLVRLLQRVADNLAYLHARAGEDRRRLRDDEERLSGLKYRFAITVEGVGNVAQHMCASEGWGPPGDNGDAVRLLGRHQVLPGDLADRLGRAVGFRDVLVHGYADVDDGLVVGRLDDLGDIDAFVAGVSR